MNPQGNFQNPGNNTNPTQGWPQNSWQPNPPPTNPTPNTSVPQQQNNFVQPNSFPQHYWQPQPPSSQPTNEPANMWAGQEFMQTNNVSKQPTPPTQNNWQQPVQAPNFSQAPAQPLQRGNIAGQQFVPQDNFAPQNPSPTNTGTSIPNQVENTQNFQQSQPIITSPVPNPPTASPYPSQYTGRPINMPPYPQKTAPAFASAKRIFFTQPVPLNAIQPEPDLDIKADSRGTLIKPIRTFEGDVAEAMARKKTSATTIALAQTRSVSGADSVSNNVEQSSSHIGLKTFFIIISIVLFGGGTYGGYYFYSRSAIAPVKPIISTSTPVATSLISTDSTKNIAIDGKSSGEIITLIKNELGQSQKANNIKEIILTKNVGGQSQKVTANDMISIMKIPAPDILIRSLTPNWMLGIYTNISGENSYFVVLGNNFFQNAFAGMLQWEKLMPDDLKFYLGNNSTSTIRGQFVDRVVRNKDVRQYRNVDDELLFFYTFLDNRRLLIGGNEDLLIEIMRRLEKEPFTR